MIYAIDKTIRVGDEVKIADKKATTEICIVLSTNEHTSRVRPWRAHIRGTDARDIVVETSKLDFACHNGSAPIMGFSFDDCGSYVDGYRSGRYWALKGDIYQAGGPGMNNNPSERDCRHWVEYCHLEKLQNTIWRDGWREGQKSVGSELGLVNEMQVRVVDIHENIYSTECVAVGVVHFLGYGNWEVEWIDPNTGDVRQDAILPSGRFKHNDRCAYVDHLDAEANLNLPEPPEEPDVRTVYQRIYAPGHDLDPYIMATACETLAEATNHHTGPCDVVEITYEDGRASSVRLIKAKDIK